jgi:hypothetical protein
MSQQQTIPQPSLPQQRPVPDWLIDRKNKTARHKSGLVIQLGKPSAHKPASLDILSIEKLVGTPWASRSNSLIEAGITLLKAL